MLILPLINNLKRLAVSHTGTLQRNARPIFTTNIVNFRITDQLCAEPTKKKKRMDPAIIKAREERRKKKIEKQIRRLEKNARQLKPLDEIEVPFQLIDQQKQRTRPQVVLSTEEVERRAVLHKQWARFKSAEYLADVVQIDRIMTAQKKALEELYMESEELYEEAIMPDLKLVPFTARGPVATPPIKNYDSPDGEYIDITKKWDN